jgi:hypothetical protein
MREHIDPQEVQKARAAGYIDSRRGMICHDKCVCEGSKPGIAETFKDRWGGILRKESSGWIWEISGGEADRFLRDIIPYLRLKREEAEQWRATWESDLSESPS